jgi:hypothetical protein
MTGLAKQLSRLFRRVWAHDHPLPGPEHQCCERPMTSLFASLSPEQRARVLAYDGPEGHGDPAFRRVD